MDTYLLTLTFLNAKTFFVSKLNQPLTIGGTSMKMKTVLMLLSIVLSTSLAIAEPQKMAQVPIANITDINLDEHNKLNVSSYVVYPNTCYKPGTTIGSVDEENKVIQIIHNAKVHPGMCGQVETPQFLPDFQIDKPENGTYKIIDPVDTRNLGEIRVDDSGVRFWKG